MRRAWSRINSILHYECKMLKVASENIGGNQVMARMSSVDAAVLVLEREGVSVAFGVPGAAINPLYAALRKRGSIRHILARHVEGASHMADGYSRAKAGAIGVCIGTSGPAGTDMITGRFRCELSGWRDSRYMDPGWIGRGGANGSGRRLQGAAIHRRGDPVGRSVVSDVSHQLPRSRTDAPRPRRRGRPHNDLPLDPGLCRGS
jgi:glyoxylate carboligase